MPLSGLSFQFRLVGSNPWTHISSIATILSRNPVSLLDHRSSNLEMRTRSSFCSGVSWWETQRAVTFRMPRSLVRIRNTLADPMSSFSLNSSHVHLLLSRSSSSTNCTWWRSVADMGRPQRAASFVSLEPSSKRLRHFCTFRRPKAASPQASRRLEWISGGSTLRRNCTLMNARCSSVVTSISNSKSHGEKFKISQVQNQNTIEDNLT